MKGVWPPGSLRVRLAAWYALTVFVILAAYGLGTYKYLHETLSADLDRRLRADVEVAETMIDRAPDGGIRWLGPTHVHEEPEELDHVLWVEAWTPSGELEYRSEMPGWLADELDPPVAGDRGIQQQEVGPGLHVRYLQKDFPVGGAPTLLRVVRSEEHLLATLGRLLSAGALGIPVAVALAALGGFWMAGRALRPVGRMAVEARAITADRLDRRLAVHDPDDELGQLATVFNQTLSRLEASFNQLRQFTSDVSHELRTPLASLRSVGEVALSRSGDEADRSAAISSMLEEGDRLTRLVERLLTLSRADAGRIELSQASLDLGEVAAAVLEDYEVLAQEKNQSLTMEEREDCPVVGDAHVLQLAIGNLVHNAISHCPEQASIRVAAWCDDQHAVVQVSDDGPGIPEAHRDRVFDRFYRVDPSRSRAGGGTGLGLAIARWAVEAHQGTLTLERAERGCVMRIALPAAPVPART